jgi:3-phosphoglycerate kinase
VAKRLVELIGKEVIYVKDSIGAEAEAAVAEWGMGMSVFGNVRFYAGKKK